MTARAPGRAAKRPLEADTSDTAAKLPAETPAETADASDKPGRRRTRRRRAGIVALTAVAVLALAAAITPVREATTQAAGAVTDDALVAMADSSTGDIDALLADLPQRNTIRSADGTTLANTWWQNRQVVTTGAIAPVMRQAQVDIEDARFYSHASFDAAGLARAAYTDLTSGDATGQGASTIEQQLAKNLTQLQAQLNGADAQVAASTDKTISRKLDDLVLAAHLEQTRSKDQLLTDYLNVVYFGDGAYGVQAAAQRYFGTTAAKLTLPQAALLAGLVQSPSAYDPLTDAKAALARRNDVLRAMWQQGDLSTARYRSTVAAPLGLHPVQLTSGCASSDQPAFCDFAVRRLLAAPQLGATQADRDRAWKLGGLTLTTTFDAKVQQATDAAITAQSLPGSAFHDAAAVVRPGTGAVLALGQDVAYGTGNGQSVQSLALDASDGGSGAFQAGSTFKTFTLAAAYAHGYGPDSVIDAPEPGTPIAFNGPGTCGDPVHQTWAPHNAPGDPTGPMTLRSALANSVNTAFAVLESRVGICPVLKVAQDLGVRQSDGAQIQALPAMTLGVDPTSPLTMAGAYAAFAADGRYCTPTPLVSLTRGGTTITFDPQCRQALDKGVATQVRDTLRSAVRHGTATAAAIPGVQVAGKTGTTDTSASTWFTGITPDLAASVWVGDLTGGTYRHLYGGDVAAPLWRRIVEPVVTAG